MWTEELKKKLAEKIAEIVTLNDEAYKDCPSHFDSTLNIRISSHDYLGKRAEVHNVYWKPDSQFKLTDSDNPLNIRLEFQGNTFNIIKGPDC